ncbi:hypothetical protein FACS18947_0600 [Bacteroidia bacterium]|nr:hypothetical protein FACS18947_0600 [Bacteroidia bacterium]
MILNKWLCDSKKILEIPYTNPEKLEPDLNVFLVKRCKGLPGDTVRVKNGNYKYSGSLYLPKANDKLVIDTTNYQLYKPLIEYETDKIMAIKENVIYLDSAVLNNYMFKMNYYFMAGDNTFNSRDSRYWGLVPEDHIVGKATLIRQSKDMNTGKRRWNRTCRTIK